MGLYLRIFQHLAPRAEAWRTTIDKTLRRFFDGLGAGAPQSFRGFVDLVHEDAFPDTTRALAKWEDQFGLAPAAGALEAERRAALAAEWASTGGQSPSYIQGVLQTAGFNVFIHEWWSSGPNPYVARDPRAYTTRPLIGTVQCTATPSTWQCTRGPALGQPQCDRFLANDPGYLVNKTLVDDAPPPVPDDPAFWPYFIYVGGQTFPDPAVIPANRRDEFERLILKLRPTQQWIVVLAQYVTDFAFAMPFRQDGAPIWMSIAPGAQIPTWTPVADEIGLLESLNPKINR